jgi:hypothetical protein
MTVVIRFTPERVLDATGIRSTPPWLSEGSVNLDEPLRQTFDFTEATETLWNGYPQVNRAGGGLPARRQHRIHSTGLGRFGGAQDNSGDQAGSDA